MSISVSVYHDEDGLVFRKYQADSGISYIAVPEDQIDLDDTSQLVRHGNPGSGNCGYYPLNLLFKSRRVQVAAAAKQKRRPPPMHWVSYARQFLRSHGIGTEAIKDERCTATA